MKTTKISLSLAVIMVAGALAFTSCKKKDKTAPIDPDDEKTSVSDNTMAEESDNDMISIGSQVSENSGTLTTFRSTDASANNELMFAASCATITSNANGTIMPIPTTYTVDFGAAGCVGTDGKVRTGKLFYDFSASIAGAKFYRNPGFCMTVSSLNYVVDGNAVNITNKTVKNTSPLGAPAGTNLTWSITANISIVKANAGGTISWSCNRTKELTNTSDPLCYSGQGTAIDWKKAKVKLNGTATGVNNKGESYTATAVNLVRDFTCAPSALHPHKHPFISGYIDYKPGNRANRHIDYGDGTCDLSAVVTINGQSWTITMN